MNLLTHHRCDVAWLALAKLKANYDSSATKEQRITDYGGAVYLTSTAAAITVPDTN